MGSRLAIQPVRQSVRKREGERVRTRTREEKVRERESFSSWTLIHIDEIRLKEKQDEMR